MNIDEAFSSVHSLDVREALRRFQPTYSVLVVSPTGDIVMVKKFKTVPEFSEIGSLLKEHHGCAAFVASAEMYPTKEEFQERVLSMKLEIQKSKRENSNRKKGLSGATYYSGLRRD